MQCSFVCKDLNTNSVSFNALKDTTKTTTILVHSKKNQQYIFDTYLIQQMDILELPDVPGTKHQNQCDSTRYRCWCTVNFSAPECLFEGLGMFSNKISTNTKHIDDQKKQQYNVKQQRNKTNKECRINLMHS